jgi:hypothetical protein
MQEKEATPEKKRQPRYRSLIEGKYRKGYNRYISDKTTRPYEAERFKQIMSTYSTEELTHPYIVKSQLDFDPTSQRRLHNLLK